jgi:hypothetical protein
VQDRLRFMSLGNLSPFDRLAHVVAGLLMLTAGWAGLATGVWRVGLEVFGWVPLITGLAGWSPFYALLGFRTNRPKP